MIVASNKWLDQFANRLDGIAHPKRRFSNVHYQQMCGIYFSVAVGKSLLPSKELLLTLKRRGPDFSQTIERRLQITDEGPELHLVFHSTVLALRGSNLIRQPTTYVDNDSVLAWNGEAWEIDGNPVDGNDTQEVFTGLTASNKTPSLSSKASICDFIASISGPFAFVFYDAPSATLFFGRDALGRRSLMYRECADSFSISSCGHPGQDDGWKELEPSGVYSICLSQAGHVSGPSDGTSISVLPFQRMIRAWDQKQQVGLISTHPGQTIPRINSAPSCQSSGYSLDMTNVDKLRSQLAHSLESRLRGIPAWKRQASTGPPSSAGTEQVGVLFSGGLDCSVLARMSHDILPLDQPIALINVAFENPRLAQTDKLKEVQYEECPDRRTGRSSLVELQQTCPGRQWLFIAVNVTFAEMVEHKGVIISLMRPHETEMDLSIAMALYFASRGTGCLSGASKVRGYATSAQILLSGLGADELFAGYIRHETACRRGGITSLIDELQLDIGRIGTRNLGRDDRVTSCWAKEMRYPFLDERLVAWVMSLPVWQKCRFGVPRLDEPAVAQGIEAAKHLLRLLAVDLGLTKISTEKKRAIQFGSRSAKMFDRKTKGTESINVKPPS